MTLHLSSDVCLRGHSCTKSTAMSKAFNGPLCGVLLRSSRQALSKVKFMARDSFLSYSPIKRVICRTPRDERAAGGSSVSSRGPHKNSAAAFLFLISFFILFILRNIDMAQHHASACLFRGCRSSRDHRQCYAVTRFFRRRW